MVAQSLQDQISELRRTFASSEPWPPSSIGVMLCVSMRFSEAIFASACGNLAGEESPNVYLNFPHLLGTQPRYNPPKSFIIYDQTVYLTL